LRQAFCPADGEVQTQILDFCSHITGSQKITAVAHVDYFSTKENNNPTIIQILLVIKDFQPRIMSYIKPLNKKTLYVFAIDKWVFEKDVEKGFLGEAVATKLVFPYSPILNKIYLQEKEVSLKKRLVVESLENLAFSFPELTNRMLIKPQFFLYEVLMNRLKLAPLIAYDAPTLIEELKQQEAKFLESYKQALGQLEREGKIEFSGDYVKISEALVSQGKDPVLKIANLSRNASRTLFNSLLGTFPQLMNIISHNTQEFMKFQKISWRRQPEQPHSFIDPHKYVFFQTADGITSLSDKIDIKGFAQQMLLKNTEDIEVEPVGGMLNDVYVIKARSNGKNIKVLAKRFKDLTGFKWIPLTVWSLGTRPFAVTAQARLSKECGINELLRSQGFNVPKILQVSNAERLIFMEFIEGESLSETIKKVAITQIGETVETELAQITRAGQVMAQVHALNVVLGDTKPDNILVKADGSMYMIDFEQATHDKRGDKSWDIAVFLYYAGHYIAPFSSGNQKAESIANAFISGYLKAGGELDAVQKAGGSKYTRVFGIFTMWSIISTISNVCRKTKLQN
jgi:tRNA A-37 threonylcarbamoyl transferase component Bud32